MSDGAATDEDSDVDQLIESGAPFHLIRTRFDSRDDAFRYYAQRQTERFSAYTADCTCILCGGRSTQLLRCHWEGSPRNIFASVIEAMAMAGHSHLDLHKHFWFSTHHPICSACYRGLRL